MVRHVMLAIIKANIELSTNDAQHKHHHLLTPRGQQCSGIGK
jgi:hypothetical protein